MRTERSIVRVELARGRINAFDLDLARGLESIALHILEKTKPPDATPFGEGLVDAGCFISYMDGKRIGGDADKKPKAMRVGKGAVVAVGYPFPARFQEWGTVRQPSRPFFTPAVIEVTGDRGLVEDAIRTALAAWLGKQTRKYIATNLKAGAV